MAEIDHSPVSFTEWSTVLAGESFDPATRERYRRCIVAYLHHLKERRERASVASAKAYVESGETQGVTDQLALDALRWFFLEAGHDIRTVQELLGHTQVETTMIYTHAPALKLWSTSVLNKPGVSVKSPFDR